MPDPQHILTVTLNPAIDRSVWIPNFKSGQVNRVRRERRNAGGKGVNIASLLADYGLRITATGWLGADNPQLFADLFNRKNINDRFVRLPGATREGIKIIDRAKRETSDINFPGISVGAEDCRRLRRHIVSLAAEHDWVALSGSLPPGAADGLYREIITEINETHGCPVALDTSGPPLREAISSCPALIKPNRAETEELLRRRLDSIPAAAEAARELSSRGIQTVAISLGAEGTVLAEHGQVLHAGVQAEDPVSTVAAGDAVVGGLLAAAGRPPAERLRLATAFAACVLRSPGANLDSRKTLESLARRVAVRRL